MTRELIARLRILRSGLGIFHDADGEAIDAAIKTINVQAEEVRRLARVITYRDAAIERLERELTAARNRIEDDAATIDRKAARIGELQIALLSKL